MRTSNHAKALFDLAKESEKVDLIHYQFESLIEQLKTNHAWIDMMDSPMVSFSKKKKNIDSISYDALFLSFLKMLAEKNQMQVLFDIFSEWKLKVRAHLKIAHVNVISAKPISKETQEKILKAIQPTFPNQSVSLHMHVDKTLIGGLKVVYQGQALDRSVARELEELYMMI
ncbi:MAG: ATP synthase F1 subunit delta [Acholeplasmataceae bacterium]|jgi:F-type H+-transporting ATPase subunit delta|nr:ATP synthase F1 subunit delta [Acholeplasmataceae bacterium]